MAEAIVLQESVLQEPLWVVFVSVVSWVLSATHWTYMEWVRCCIPLLIFGAFLILITHR